MAIVTPQDLKDRGDVASLPLNTADLFVVWQGGKLVTVDAGEVGGGLKTRQIITYTTPDGVVAGQIVPITIPAFPAFDLQSINVDGLCRIRLYADEASRDADLFRPIRAPEPQGCGLKYEFISDFTLLGMYTQPEVSISTGSDGAVHGSLTNIGTGNQIFTITLTVLQKEEIA